MSRQFSMKLRGGDIMDGTGYVGRYVLAASLAHDGF